MKHFPMLLLLVAAGATGYGFYLQHREQAQLNAQLYHLDQLLAADNEIAGRRTNNTVRGIENEVVKNQNQPKDVAILAAARKLHSDADALARTVQGLAAKLRRVSGNTALLPTLPNAGATAETEKLLGPASEAYRGLHQQLASFETALEALHPVGKHALLQPQFTGLPVAAALASLSQLESDVRAAELSTLQYLTPKVGARNLGSHLMAFASAEANTVAPGEIYRAQLFLGSVFDLRHISVQMRCGGQPISIDSRSVGQVRFRAPLKPGPTVWTGSIRLNNNGRDTTFQVRVPYRVVRR